MKKLKLITVLLLFAQLSLSSCNATQRHADTDDRREASSQSSLANPVDYANPMCGTGAYPVRGGNNNCFPGPVAPFGMIQWSPDTETGTHKSGYFVTDKRISDFSLNHFSGVGCTYGEDFAMMPIVGPKPSAPPQSRTDFAQAFSHENEIARPGYYSVTLNNAVKVELTTTARSGFGRFTYPQNAPATLMINAASDINGSDAAEIHIDPFRREITGWSYGGFFCHGREEHRGERKVYLYAVFDHPFMSFSTWSDPKLHSNATGAYITFDTSANSVILAKVGISYVSIENAKANVEAENPISAFSSADFDRAVKAASDVWNTWLNKIQITSGTLEQRQTFYSMLYHALIGPSIVSDANGQYLGYDQKVHSTADHRVQYGVISGWDIYHSECQLLAMLAPKEASDIAQSLLIDYQQGGTFPRWGVTTMDSGDMIGDPAAPMIAEFYAFGARNFDAKASLGGLIKAATDPSVYSPISRTYERDSLPDYLKLGYVPEHPTGQRGSVCMTLEYASADFALSQFAASLGDEHDAALLLQHAQNWQNLFNPQTHYLQMRRRDGSWAPGFRDDIERYDDDLAYVEGTAAQYMWMVPFNLKGLVEKMGGPDVAAHRLDDFFTKLNDGETSRYAFLGNESCIHTPWIYTFIGQPWKTQQVVRSAITQLYSNGYTAYPGNDDVGEMSSWYIFAALGMYPEIPGSDVLVLHGPLFPKAVVHLPDADLTIAAHGAAANAPYVQRLNLNGREWTKPWVFFHDISRGATLTYDLDSVPSTTWGTTPADAPPSYRESR